jgi:hypothetical protein
MGASYSFKATRNPKVFVGTYESSTCEDEAMLVLTVHEPPTRGPAPTTSVAAPAPIGAAAPEPIPGPSGASELDVDAPASSDGVKP